MAARGARRSARDRPAPASAAPARRAAPARSGAAPRRRPPASKRREPEPRGLRAIERGLIGLREEGPLLGYLLDAMCGITGASRGAFLRQKARGVELLATRGEGPKGRRERPSLEGADLQAALRAGRPCVKRFRGGRALLLPLRAERGAPREAFWLEGDVAAVPREIVALLPSIAVALETARALARADHERRRLSGLYRLATTTGAAEDLRTLLSSALDVVMQEVGGERGMLVLHGTEAEGPLTVAKGREGIAVVADSAPAARTGGKEAPWPRSGKGPSTSTFSSCLPLRVGPLASSTQLGVLCVDRPRDTSPEEMELLAVMAAQIASAVERQRLREAQADRTRLQEELRQAEKVQALLLPPRMPDLVGLSFDVEYHLTRGLGGDYYDVIEMEGEQIGIAIADVLGHSVSSAIVMSMCRTLLREYCRHESSPARILRKANDTLERNLPDDMFVTLFLAVLDLRTLSMTYANAGQCYPLHFRKAGPAQGVRSAHVVAGEDGRGRSGGPQHEVLAIGGLPLGFQRGVDYREAQVELSPSDILVLYTDGVTEVRLQDGRQLSVRGLTTIVRRLMMSDSPRLARDIYRAIGEEVPADGMGGSDDFTLITLRVGRDLTREFHELPSTEEGIRLGVEIAEAFARRNGFVSDRILQFRLVLTEAFTNAMEHGNGGDPSLSIALLLCADGRRMSVRIRDRGAGYDVERVLEQAQDPDLTSARGRGLTIIRRYVDAVEVGEKGNVTTLTFSRSTF